MSGRKNSANIPGDLKPGVYTLNTSQTPYEMMAIMSNRAGGNDRSASEEVADIRRGAENDERKNSERRRRQSGENGKARRRPRGGIKLSADERMVTLLLILWKRNSPFLEEIEARGSSRCRFRLSGRICRDF